MAIFSDTELASLVEEVTEIIGDESISTTIIYKLASGTTALTWSPTTQIIPAMFTNSSVSAFRGSYTTNEIEESGGLIEKGDTKFILMTSSSVTGILGTDDLITEEGSDYQSATTYVVLDVKRDPLDISFFIAARQV